MANALLSPLPTDSLPRPPAGVDLRSLDPVTPQISTLREEPEAPPPSITRIQFLTDASDAPERRTEVTDANGGTVVKRYILPIEIPPEQRDAYFRELMSRTAKAQNAELLEAADPSFLQDLKQATVEQLPFLGGQAAAHASSPGVRLALKTGMKALPGGKFIEPLLGITKAEKKALKAPPKQSITDVTARTVAATPVGALGGVSLRDIIEGEVTSLQEQARTGQFTTLLELGTGVVGKLVSGGSRVLRERLRRADEITAEAKQAESLIQELNIQEAAAVREGVAAARKEAGLPALSPEALKQAEEGKRRFFRVPEFLGGKRTPEEATAAKIKESQAPGLTLARQRLDIETGDVTPRFPITFIETALRRFPITARIFELPEKKTTELLQKQARRIVDAVDDEFGESGLAKLLIDEVQGTQTAAKRIVGDLHKTLRTATPGVTVDTRRVKLLMDRFTKEKRPGMDTLIAQLRAIDDDVAFAGGTPGTLFDAVMAGKPISFADASILRQNLLAFGRGPAMTDGIIAAQSLTSPITRILKKALADSASTLSPALRDLFLETKNISRQLYENILSKVRKRTRGGTFEEGRASLSIPLVDKISKEPARAAEFLLRPNTSDTIRALKILAGDGWPKVQTALQAELFKRASAGGAPVIIGGKTRLIVSGKVLRAEIRNLGNATMKEVFGPEQTQFLGRLADTMTGLEAPVKGLGAMVVALTAGTALTGAVGTAATFDLISLGEAAGAVTLIVVSPIALAKIVTNPQFIRVMERGLREGARGNLQTLANLGDALTRPTAQFLGARASKDRPQDAPPSVGTQTPRRPSPVSPPAPSTPTRSLPASPGPPP